MPVIVVGADTPVGDAIVDLVLDNAVEVRAFISDESRKGDFKRRGAKVATGDVSDASHVEGAALRCFCAVLVMEAATDGRERSFAEDGQAVVAGWAEAIIGAGVHRTIWVGSPAELSEVPSSTPEVATVAAGPDIVASARAVAALEETDKLTT